MKPSPHGECLHGYATEGKLTFGLYVFSCILGHFLPPFWMPDLQLCSIKGRKPPVQKRFIPAVVGRDFSKCLSDKAVLWTWVVAVPVSHISRSRLNSLARKILPFYIHRRKNFSQLGMLSVKRNYSNVMSCPPMLPSSKAENFKSKTLN